VSLKSLGIKVTGRSVKRRKNYRSTQEILRWSTALLLGRPVAQLEDENRNDTLLGYRSALRGQGPTVHAATTEEAELDALVSRVRAWLDAGVGAGEIGVSDRFKRPAPKPCRVSRRRAFPRLRCVPPTPPGTQRRSGFGTMHSFKGLAVSPSSV